MRALRQELQHLYTPEKESVRFRTSYSGVRAVIFGLAETGARALPGSLAGHSTACAPIVGQMVQ
eukprot:6175569-Pleurochrysis_carterae.AAC.1